MAKYLIKASYTADGAKGVLKEGGSKRRAAADAALKSVGCQMESFYFAFGNTDAYLVVEAPDHATISAASLAINATGAVRSETVVLLTPEEIDAATKKRVKYRAPGR
jgi:uncharacterized protein with GYD domain